MKADARKADEWAERLERLSGWAGTVAAFCERERVSLAMLYYWRRKIGTETSDRRRRAVQVDASSFQAVEVIAPGAVLEVNFDHGARLEVRGSDLDVVSAVVAELVAGAPSC